MFNMKGMDIENIDTEWKESWASKYLKTIAAFHNTEGGRMIIGRKDDGTYIGVPNIKKETKIVADNIRDKLHIKSKTRAEVFEGKDCIVIDVPKGDKMVEYDGRFYIRVGNTTQRIEGEDLKTVLLDERDMGWLDQHCNLSVDDLSSEAIEYFINKGHNCERIPSSITKDDIDSILDKFALRDENGRLTLTAAILFTDVPFRFNHGASLGIGLFDSDGSLIRDEKIEGPMISIPDRAMDSLYEKFIPPTYKYDGGGASRYLHYDYPKEAVRELILNALMHMDYSKQQPATVSIYPDHLEIYSIGGLISPMTLGLLKSKHPSIIRNSSLSKVFYSAGFVESWGQGIGKVLKSCRDNGNSEPEFSEYVGGMLVSIAVAPSKSVSSVKDTADSVCDSIVNIIRSNPNVRVEDMASELGISEKTIRTRLSKLKDAGVVTREGGRKTGRWILTSPDGDNH